MSQDQAIDAARTRIQRLVEEIALLSKKELPSEQYFAEFITRVVKACDARGGAVWLVGQRTAEGKNEFQLAGQVEFESSLFHTDEVQRALLLHAMQETAGKRQPIVLQPSHQEPDRSSIEAQVAQLQGQQPPTAPGNRTPYPFIHVPLPLKDSVVGVLQVWMQPYVTPANYAEFAQFLTSLAGYVEAHLQSRRLGSLVIETQRLQHLLKFTTDLAGSLDPLEVSRLAANYGRDLVGCERCAVLWREGTTWKVVSISGQEVVEKKSSMVKAMSAFVGAHVRDVMVTLSKKELLARHAASAEAPSAAPNGATTDEIDLAYFDVSHVVSAAIAPVLDDEKQLVGAFFAESTSEGFFDTKEAPAHRVTEWLALHTGKTLRAADDYQTLPFLPVTRRMRATRLALTGPHRKRNWLRIGIFGGIAAVILLWPWTESVDGNCSITPQHHIAIVPEVAGRVEKIFVVEGTKVAKGDPIAQLDKKRVETELETNEQEKRRLYADSERLRGLGDEASAQVSLIQAKTAEKTEQKLRADLEATTLRSPIDGVVLTKDVEKHAGEFWQAGQPFAEVASLDAWDVHVEVSEHDIGRVENRLAKGPIDVRYILYSASADQLTSKLEKRSQISAAAEPRDKDTVFVATLDNVEVPEDMRGSLRPGLTGRASIQIGRRPLGLHWVLRLANWAVLRWWSW